jgi:hypothetical protein
MGGEHKAPVLYHCGMCAEKLPSRAALDSHTRDHEEVEIPKLACPVCSFRFNDSLALEAHQLLNSHGLDQQEQKPMRPPVSKKAFAGPSAIRNDPPSPLLQPKSQTRTEKSVECDRCMKTFSTRQAYDVHRSFQNDGPCADHNHKSPRQNRVGYQDPDKPEEAMQQNPVYASLEDGRVSEADTPTNLSDDEVWCHKCKSRFGSLAKYSTHALWCVSKHGSSFDKGPVIVGSKAPSLASKTYEVQPGTQANQQRLSQPVLQHATNRLLGPQHVIPQHSAQNARTVPPPAPAAATAAATLSSYTSSNVFACNYQGCDKTYKSEGGLKVHKMDSHGIGGQQKDLRGQDSWMLTQRMREQLKAQGVLHPPSSPSGGRGRGGRAPPAAARASPVAPRSSQVSRPQARQQQRASGVIPAFGHQTVLPSLSHHGARSATTTHIPTQHPVQLPTSQNMGGALEMEQAKYIQDKILRLLVETNIFIHHDGRMAVCDIHWFRIGVQKQPEVVSVFDGMCHLPKVLQDEYLPPPQALASEYEAQYPASEFETSPPRDRFKPGLGVVVLSCSKVVLANGLQEAVKIAAIDLSTCRILLNHFVCTDPTAPVANWRSPETGLFSWDDMESARKHGFKIFKGWSTARAALWKFIDKDTVVVGHNLRGDLDALRMVHGRAVDMAKVAEKAAKGPLNKVQLGLDSLCRAYPGQVLKSDPEFGREPLMNAFAARELGLWIVKNKDKFERDMRQKSVDYQKVMPRAAVAGG